jgi:hypothetical protein
MRRLFCVVMALCAALAVVAPTTAAADEGGNGGDEGGHSCPSSKPVQLRHAGTTMCFPTIQSAVNAANSGDQVVAQPHIYDENVTIPVGKDNITVRSLKGPEDTRIVGNLNGSSTESVVEIDASSVRLGGPNGRTGFTIENGAAAANPASFDLHGVGIGFDGGITTGVQVTGNHIQNIAGPEPLPLTGFGRVDGVAATNATQAAIRWNEVGPISAALPAGSSNVFGYGVIFFGSNSQPAIGFNAIHDISVTGPCPGTGALGVAINDATSGATVSGNAVWNVLADCAAAGISSGAPGVPLSITDNVVADVSSNASPSQAAGIALKGSGATVTASGNLLTHDNAGVAVLAPLSSTTHINHNDFSRNPIGVYNQADPSLDATLNYWGCSDGPGAPGCDTVVDVAPGHTTYIPFLTQSIRHHGENGSPGDAG